MPFTALLPLCISTDGVKVIPEALGIGFANPVKVFNYGITCHDLYLNQFLRSANNGRLVPKRPDQQVYFGPKCGIGNMRAIPSQQIVHPTQGCRSNM